MWIPSVLWCYWLGGRKGIRPVKIEWWGAVVVICLERGADLHVAQLMPLPLTVSCFSKIQIGFSFLVPSHPGSSGKRAVKWVCVLHSMWLGLCNGTVSVRLSCESTTAALCGGFAAVGLAGSRLLHGWRHSSTMVGSKCEQCHVSSCRRRLNSHLFWELA